MTYYRAGSIEEKKYLEHLMKKHSKNRTKQKNRRIGVKEFDRKF
jgi:hypothetical protein